jgi:hypothetical protein
LEELEKTLNDCVQIESKMIEADDCGELLIWPVDLLQTNATMLIENSKQYLNV